LFGLKYLWAEDFIDAADLSLQKSHQPLLCFPAKRNIVHLLQILKKHHYETFRHSINVARWSFLIAKEIGLSPDKVITVTIGGLLHDIGKIKIAPLILEKSTKLTDQEWHLIKQHPLTGVNILSAFPWTKKIEHIIAYHHERMDGKGYLGLKGLSIPLEARIICIADAFDAMISRRPYQPSLSLHETCAELMKNSGTQFDAHLAQTLVTLTSQKKLIGEIEMPSSNETVRQAEISLKFSQFEIPPMQDVLLVGRKAPIGPEAARRMVNALSPNQYEIIPQKEGHIEAVIVRKSLLDLIPQEKLLPIILEEGVKAVSETTVAKAQLDLTIVVKRVVEL